MNNFYSFLFLVHFSFSTSYWFFMVFRFCFMFSFFIFVCFFSYLCLLISGDKNKNFVIFYFSFVPASRLQQLQQMQQFETQQQPQQEYSQQSSKSPVQSQSQQQLQQTTNNINRKLNGFLNLKTPLIGYVLHWPMIDRLSVFALSRISAITHHYHLTSFF